MRLRYVQSRKAIRMKLAALQIKEIGIGGIGGLSRQSPGHAKPNIVLDGEYMGKIGVCVRIVPLPPGEQYSSLTGPKLLVGILKDLLCHPVLIIKLQQIIGTGIGRYDAGNNRRVLMIQHGKPAAITAKADTGNPGWSYGGGFQYGTNHPTVSFPNMFCGPFCFTVTAALHWDTGGGRGYNMAAAVAKNALGSGTSVIDSHKIICIQSNSPYCW